jgi:hypothetical protein
MDKPGKRSLALLGTSALGWVISLLLGVIFRTAAGVMPSSMPKPGDLAPGFMAEEGRCRRMIYGTVAAGQGGHRPGATFTGTTGIRPEASPGPSGRAIPTGPGWIRSIGRSKRHVCSGAAFRRCIRPGGSVGGNLLASLCDGASHRTTIRTHGCRKAEERERP